MSHLSVSLWALAALALPAAAQSPTLSVEENGQTTRLLLRRGPQTTVVRTTDAAVEGAHLRAVPGSSNLAVTWEESGTPYYAISLDGARFHEAKATSYDLALRLGDFDPTRRELTLPAALRAETGNRLFIVQYWTQGLESYRRSIRDAGGAIHLFLARHANVVEMDPRAAAAVRELPFVRWVGPYHTAYKLEEGLSAMALAAAGPRQLRVNLLTMRRGPRGQDPVIARILEMGASVDSVSRETYLINATVTPGQVLDLARMNEVQWIDLWSAPETDMNIARDFHGANYVESLAGYTGAGVRVEVMDGGCDEIHPDLQNFVVHGGNTPSAHGTATSGIVLGSGAGNFNARGGMPDAFLAIADYNFMSGSRYNHTAELQNPNLTYKAVLQSNSWGSSRTTQYTSTSQEMDLILFDHDRISILQSQSNAGNQDSRPQAWAKNIISVGGIRHQNTLGKSDDNWSFGASIGPAADGRIKPDLASFYDATLCTDQVGSAGYASGNYYSSFGGTSGATPIIAGHLGLLYEMWADGLFGNSAPGATVFDDRPFNTTAKALLINTATQWSFAGTNHDLTRTHQGWGHADLINTYDLRNQIFVVDETDVLSNLQSTVHSLTVDPGAPAFKATLVYRDNPGTTSSSLHRINDLDLKVTAPGGTVYWGNNGLDAAMWSTSGGTANTVDTVENVFVQNPGTGTWSVEVIASELNQDTHVETGALDADYALVVSGVTTGPPPPPVAGFVGSPTSGFAPLGVQFTDQSTGSISTWSWDFGDTNTSSQSSPLHTYANAGTYTVQLTVTGPGGSDTFTRTNYVTASQPQPPAAPTNLVATAASNTRIDLDWNDNSSNEDTFVVERSPDGSTGWTQVGTTGANQTSFSDTGLLAGTTHHYRVYADNTAGSSAFSNVASATTSNGTTVQDVADGEVPVAGSVTSGSFQSTWAGDGTYQSIIERQSGGKKADRYSFMEHKWTVPVSGGSTVTFNVRAHHSVSADGDDFVFAWSSDDSSYADMLTVTKTVDDGSYQSFTLPSSVSGTVWIRARDTNRALGSQGNDTLFVDHLYIESEGSGGGLPPSAPSGLTATAVSQSRIDLNWTDGSSNEDTFELERSPDGSSWSSLASVGANVTSYSDTGLSASTTYWYRARAVNTAGASGWSNTASETTLPAGTVEDVSSSEIAVSGTVSGSHTDTHTNNVVYESILERESGGRPNRRHSYLEHKWVFDVSGGSTVTFNVKAYHSVSSDGDDFVFAWSNDDVNYTDMLTVTKTADDGSYQSFSLPAGTSGTVYVRVLDTDQSQGNRPLDTVFVDHMFIRSQ